MKIKTGSDFSGVGAFDYAINRVCKSKGLTHERVYACDWDKYARITYKHNHGEPDYYPKDVYDRIIPEDPLDVYMTSPPCQAFSMAGKRKGKEDERGILFFNSHQFIQKNKPRYFIFENVKGLLSVDNGKTFSEWCNMLGGKSVNGNPVIFPYNNSVPYHIYFKLINTKDHGVPQNRERVFIVGIRDDEDNNFRWPIEDPQDKKLIDIVEQEVSEKYFLSEDAIKKLDNTDHLDTNRVANTLRCSGGGSVSKKHSFDVIRVGNINPSGNGMNGNVFDEQGISPILTTNKGEGIKIKSKSVCIPVLTPDRPNKRQNGRRFKEDDEPSFIITTQDRHGIYDGYRLRRLTPRECFRLQDFPDSFDFSVVSDTQAYKQAGNSITVRVLEKILNNLL